MGEFGIKAAHAQISDTCRSEKGDDGAFVEGVEVLRKAYRAAVEGREGYIGVKYHLVLYVEPHTNVIKKVNCRLCNDTGAVEQPAELGEDKLVDCPICKDEKERLRL